MIETIALRHVAEVKVSNVDKKSVDAERSVRLCNYTDVYYQDVIDPETDFMVATATNEQVRAFSLRAGDILLTKDSETPDDIAVPAFVASDLPGVLSGYHLALVRADPSRIEPRFLFRIIQSDCMRKQFAAAASGVTRYGLSYGAIRGAAVPLAVADLEEQRRIADFLDDHVSRIDQAIGVRQRQAVSLQEQIGAVAHAEATGALCLNRKPSGLAWSPSLPSHWGSTRLANVARLGTGHTPSRSEPEYWVDCDIPWVTTTDVKRFRYDGIDSIIDTEVHISQLGLRHSSAVMHPAGTVVLTRTSASAGFSIVMEVSMATSQDCATWTPGPLLDSFYLLWCLRAMRRDLLERLAMGSTHKTIYFPDLEGIKIPLPPMVEQRSIVERIALRANVIRSAQMLVASSIRLLEERKNSLITAAVTGELDVTTATGRGVACRFQTSRR